MKYLVDGKYYGKISKRDYEHLLFTKSLPEDLSADDYCDAKRAHLNRRNDDVISALVDRDDETERGIDLVGAIYDAIHTDREDWETKAQDILAALYDNNAEALLTALCGWNSTSLAKQAFLIPDDGENYYRDAVPTKMTACWSNGKKTRAKCFVDAKSSKVYGYDTQVLTAYQNEATIASVSVEMKTCYGKKCSRCCITKEQRESTGDYVSYWYSTDSEEAQHPEEYVIIDNPFTQK